MGWGSTGWQSTLYIKICVKIRLYVFYMCVCMFIFVFMCFIYDIVDIISLSWPPVLPQALFSPSQKAFLDFWAYYKLVAASSFAAGAFFPLKKGVPGKRCMCHIRSLHLIEFQGALSTPAASTLNILSLTRVEKSEFRKWINAAVPTTNRNSEN